MGAHARSAARLHSASPRAVGLCHDSTLKDESIKPRLPGPRAWRGLPRSAHAGGRGVEDACVFISSYCVCRSALGARRRARPRATPFGFAQQHLKLHLTAQRERTRKVRLRAPNKCSRVQGTSVELDGRGDPRPRRNIGGVCVYRTDCGYCSCLHARFTASDLVPLYSCT